MSKELEKKLHPHEKKILLALKKMKEGFTSDIAKKSGLSEATVHKAGQWASIKGLVRHEEHVEKKTKLTRRRFILTGPTATIWTAPACRRVNIRIRATNLNHRISF